MQSGAKRANIVDPSRAFQRVFTCKIRLRYSRGRASQSLPKISQKLESKLDSKLEKTQASAIDTLAGKVSAQRARSSSVPASSGTSLSPVLWRHLQFFLNCCLTFTYIYLFFGKLRKARSRLYRRQMLQANNYSKYLFEQLQNNVSVYEGVELEDYVFCGPSVVFTNIKIPRSEFPQKGTEYYSKTIVKKSIVLIKNMI